MVKDFVVHRPIFDTGHHLDLYTAALTGFNIDIEYPFQALRQVMVSRRFRKGLQFNGYSGCLTLAPLGRCHSRPVLTVGREHTLKACQVNAGFGYQGGKPCDKIQRTLLFFC